MKKISSLSFIIGLMLVSGLFASSVEKDSKESPSEENSIEKPKTLSKACFSRMLEVAKKSTSEKECSVAVLKLAGQDEDCQYDPEYSKNHDPKKPQVSLDDYEEGFEEGTALICSEEE